MADWVTETLRASAATSGASEQDSAVTLPRNVKNIFVRVEKTAEANADNLLTVRLQARVGSADWVDVPWTWNQLKGAEATAADTATDETRTPNIVDASSTAAFVYLAYYSELPSNIIRIASVSSGTTPANTFEADAAFDLYQS